MMRETSRDVDMNKREFAVPWKTVARLQALGLSIVDYVGVSLLCVTTAQFFPSLQLDRFAGLDIGAISILIFWMVGLYKRERSIMNILETQKLCRAALFIFLILGVFFMRKPSLNTLFQLFGFMICLFVVIEMEKFLFFKLDQHFLRKGIGWERVIVYNNEEAGGVLAERMLRFPKFGKLPVGFLVDKVENSVWEKKNPALGHIDDVENFFEINKADTFIVSKPEVPQDLLFSLQQTCRKRRIKFELDPYLCGLYLGAGRINNVSGLSLSSTPQANGALFHRAFKRTIDLIFSVLILVLTFPLFLVLIFLIKRDSGGEAIFKQERCGKDGKLFTMLKFRTMHPQVKKYDYHPRGRNDERVTRLGRILRQTSLDELPQLTNVVKGEMSLVGPRPEMPFIVKTYDGIRKQRLLVKPGITGLWQISADRSRPIHENIEYDLYYVQNQSPLLDIAILMRTIISTIRGLGAF